jgi:hypothetical protein
MKMPLYHGAPASRGGRIGRRISAAIVTLLCSLFSGTSQGTFTVTFDGPPLRPPGTQDLVQQYYDSGVWFLPIPGTDGFVRNGGGITGYPDDGTAYVQSIQGGSPMFGLADGSSFDPVSVDLAEYSAVVRDPETVHFVGYRADGTVLTDDITTAGIFNGVAPVFQTFAFSPAFSGLTRVEISPVVPWSLDNLTLRRSVPEPGTGALVGIGALLVGVHSLRRKKSG